MKKSLVMFLLLVFTGIEFNGVAQAAIPPLHTDGNKIKDPNGNVVVLRGIALIDLGHLEDWQGGAINMIDRLTDKTDTQGSSPGWYPKVIRIMIAPPDSHGDWWPYEFDPDDNDDLYDLLRTVVDYCASKDLYVIIDWHYIANTYEHVATTSAFWEYMAPRFANDSHVIFELFNEPINDINSDWIFNSNDPCDWVSVRDDMQTWIDIVRTYAPDNLILVAGAFYSQLIGPAASYPLTGDNIAIVSHIYPGHWTDSYWSSSYQNQITTCATVYPVIMTEWGFSQSNHPNPNDLLNGTITEYGQPLMDFIEGLKIGNTAWVASHNWGPPMFWGDWTLRIGEGEMGGFVKDTLYLRRNDDQPSPDRIDFTEYADFATQWRRTGCNPGNGFCEGADMDESGEVAWPDLKMWVDQWLKTGQSYLTADLAPDAGDGIVNMADLRILADNWLAGL